MTILDPLLNHRVVIDLKSQYVCLGKLIQIDSSFVKLIDADVHDLRDSSTTRENYIIDARKSGINPNRKEVFIRTEEIVAIALFKHVIESEDQ